MGRCAKLQLPLVTSGNLGSCRLNDHSPHFAMAAPAPSFSLGPPRLISRAPTPSIGPLAVLAAVSAPVALVSLSNSQATSSDGFENLTNKQSCSESCVASAGLDRSDPWRPSLVQSRKILTPTGFRQQQRHLIVHRQRRGQRSGSRSSGGGSGGSSGGRSDRRGGGRIRGGCVCCCRIGCVRCSLRPPHSLDSAQFLLDASHSRHAMPEETNTHTHNKRVASAAANNEHTQGAWSAVNRHCATHLFLSSLSTEPASDN